MKIVVQKLLLGASLTISLLCASEWEQELQIESNLIPAKAKIVWGNPAENPIREVITFDEPVDFFRIPFEKNGQKLYAIVPFIGGGRFPTLGTSYLVNKNKFLNGDISLVIEKDPQSEKPYIAESKMKVSAERLAEIKRDTAAQESRESKKQAEKLPAAPGGPK